MNLLDLTTMQPISESDLYARFPYVSFPADLTGVNLANFGVAQLVYTSAPSSQYATVAQSGYVLNGDGTYSTNWTSTPISLAQAQQIQLDALTAYAQKLAWADITYNGATIPTNAKAGVIMAHIAAGTTTITFKGDNSVFIQVAPTDAIAIQTAMADQIGLAFAVEAQLVTQIQALSTVDAVAAYDVASNWTTVQASLTSQPTA